jgi:hypothetical protein
MDIKNRLIQICFTSLIYLDTLSQEKKKYMNSYSLL